jgi:succinyl-CoA synthetase alpha subunit
MSILINRDSRILVQGITGREGGFHAQRCIEYGTNVVAGVTPGKGGTTFMDRVPIFDTIERAVSETGADVSLVFVPPEFAADAVLEAASAGVPLIACITEGIPVLDSMRMMRYLEGGLTRLIGPNCPGLISPAEKCKVGIMPGNIHSPGKVGVVSRSGTLTYEAVLQLTDLGVGQSTCVGIGGDPISGTTFVDVLQLFEDDPETEAIVLIGEIGGTKEQEAAEFIKTEVTKPVVGLVVGQAAPPGKRMGHAGAIITGKAALASEKNRALKEAGVTLAPNPAQIGITMQRVLSAMRYIAR